MLKASTNNQVISGVLIIDKPAGVTSHDVVNSVRRIFGTRQVGHTGTLDPMATGVLVVLVGSAVKASEYFLDGADGTPSLNAGYKRYEAVMKLGIETDTEDIWGKTLNVCHDLPGAQKVLSVATSFIGKIEQIPPMFSALKVGGKKLVDIAREGGTVERKPRTIDIAELSIVPISEAEYSLSVKCSSGTYIRTLCADIGKALGCFAAMSALRRTEVCGFGIDQSISLDALSDLDAEERTARLIPTEELFAHLEIVSLPAFYERLAKNGCEIYQKKIRSSFPVGSRVRIYGEGGFFALGEVREFPSGSAVKILKFF